VESLGVAEVAARLEDRFALAVGENRAVPARQRALQAALDWSYSLLDDDERLVLRRLGVFVGGWTLTAAESICAGDELRREQVVDALGRLVTKSLVVADHDCQGVRYRLHESVRMYAVSQLEATGQTVDVQGRHAGYMLQLAERTPHQALN